MKFKLLAFCIAVGAAAALTTALAATPIYVQISSYGNYDSTAFPSGSSCGISFGNDLSYDIDYNSTAPQDLYFHDIDFYGGWITGSNYTFTFSQAYLWAWDGSQTITLPWSGQSYTSPDITYWVNGNVSWPYAPPPNNRWDEWSGFVSGYDNSGLTCAFRSDVLWYD